MIRCHVFTNIAEVLFLKQVPNFAHECDGVEFSYGLEVPNDIDVLLVYTRASYSLVTRLPKERTIFVAGEPDVIHPFSTRFMNQFGLVLTSSPKALKTDKIHDTICSMPFVGLNFNEMDNPLNLTHFANMDCIEKDDRISVVTSSKAYTDFHKKRLVFLTQLKEKIPDKLVLYGRGFRSIDDKKDALLPHKYHLSLENGGGPFTWTEKLSDPLLCFALPFYHGCENYADNLPADAAVPIELENVDAVINIMMKAQKNKLWEQRHQAMNEARHLILTKFNLVKRFASLAKLAMAKDVTMPNSDTKRLIRSERSLWPEPGCRGSVAQCIIRSTILSVWPTAELQAASLHRKMEAQRIKKRNIKIVQAEKEAQKDQSLSSNK